jgi:transposase
MDATGKIVREAKVASEPEALIPFLTGLPLPRARLGLEAGPLSPGRHAALVKAGFEGALLETRHVKAALSARIVKTDRRDARGIAQLLRMGWFRPVPCKSPPAQDVRARLVARKQLPAQMRDGELSLRGLLRGFGLKVGEISKGQFAARVRTLVAGPTMLERIAEARLQAREALRAEVSKLHRARRAIVRGDEVCRRLMTVPGVGALVAVTFTSGVDAPERFSRSRAVGAPFGLTPKTDQSGETDITGAVSRVGDVRVRTARYEAAHILLTRAVRVSALQRGALEVAKRRGLRRAKGALARKVAVILHRMWVDGTTFRWGREAAAA